VGKKLVKTQQRFKLTLYFFMSDSKEQKATKENIRQILKSPSQASSNYINHIRLWTETNFKSEEDRHMSSYFCISWRLALIKKKPKE
jgi:hypothetical protein